VGSALALSMLAAFVLLYALVMLALRLLGVRKVRFVT
jgi:hypothetical protein